MIDHDANTVEQIQPPYNKNLHIAGQHVVDFAALGFLHGATCNHVYGLSYIHLACNQLVALWMTIFAKKT